MILSIMKTTVMGVFFGTLGTMLGGFVGATVNVQSKRFLSCTLSLASGLMISVVGFDLIPEALEYADIFSVILSAVAGVITMIICDYAVQKKFNNTYKVSDNNEKWQLLKTGIIISIGLALHNIPEGLAIRSRI